jgi:hypothetical protein
MSEEIKVTHGPHSDDPANKLKSLATEEEALEYLLAMANSDRAHDLLTQLSKDMVVDEVLATLAYTIALYLFITNRTGQETNACAKAQHIGNFIHMATHALFDQQEDEDEAEGDA